MQAFTPLNRPAAGGHIAGGIVLGAPGCQVDYEHLPQKFELAKGPRSASARARSLYSRGDGTPRTNKVPARRGSSPGVGQEPCNSDSLDVTAVVADDVADADAWRLSALASSIGTDATIVLDSLAPEQHVFAAPPLAWAAPEE